MPLQQLSRARPSINYSLYRHSNIFSFAWFCQEGLNTLQIAASSGSINVVKKLVELDFAKCSADTVMFIFTIRKYTIHKPDKKQRCRFLEEKK